MSKTIGLGCLLIVLLNILFIGVEAVILWVGYNLIVVEWLELTAKEMPYTVALVVTLVLNMFRLL